MSVPVSRPWAIDFVEINANNPASCDYAQMRRVSVLASALLVIATVAPHAAADPTADLTARLNAAIEARVAEMGVPGAIVSLSIPGEIDYVRAVGVSDTATGAPMSVDDHTRIGSVTKTFTGTAVLQLVDQGRIRLSDRFLVTSTVCRPVT